MLLLQIILATSIVSIVSLIGILTIYRQAANHKPLLKIIISLAAGSLLAISFLDLLPESLNLYQNANVIFSVTLTSFLVFFIIEKYWHWHHCLCLHDKTHENDEKKSLVYTNLIGDGIHNFVDGFLIASAFMLDFNTGILATFAVILHEIPQEISDFGILLYGGLNKMQAIFYNVLFALTAVIGGIFSYLFGRTFEEYIPLMTAFAAGNFIYLASADLIPELHHEKNPSKVWQHTVWLIVGVLLVFILKTILPEAI